MKSLLLKFRKLLKPSDKKLKLLVELMIRKCSALMDYLILLTL